MDNVVEKTGRTVEEAVELALDDLNANEDEVSIEILDEGNKGILGLLGNKMARVRVTLNDTQGDIGARFLVQLLQKMNIEAEIELEEDDELLSFNILGKKSGIIIGRRGETLDALQYLVSLVVNKGGNEYKRVVVDVENYREKRQKTLVTLSKRLAEKVITTKKSVTLEPMNPYERRIIHSTLQDNNRVKTYSVGEEPFRKVIITLR